MTLPRFDINDFPIETDQPQIEVTLPVGQHTLELVVEDSAGLRSAPATVVITIEQSPPVINQIQPNSGTQGSTVRAQVQGENLLGVSQVSFSGTGVTASILPGGTNNSVPVEITIAPQAALGGRSFSVTTPGGTASSPSGVQFTVQQNAPVIRSISPAAGTQGTPSLQVTIAGENLAGARDVTFSGNGVALNRIVSSTASSVVTDIAIASSARSDDRSFSVTTPGGRADSPAGVVFTVQQAAPIINGIDPDTVTPGSRVTATITGANLTGASRVDFSGTGITVERISGSSDSSVSVNLAVDASAAPGARSFSVTTPGGTANSPGSVSLTVHQPAPVISSIVPRGGLQGQTVDAIIGGSNLSGARAVTFSGTGVIGRISNSTDNQVTLEIAIDGNAATGDRTFTVQTPQGNANSADSQVAFRVSSIIFPTIVPTISPTISPTIAPTIRPTISPTLQPTTSPTISPTLQPTFSPTLSPTLRPVIDTATVSPRVLDDVTRLSSSNTEPVDTILGIGPTYRGRLESGGINTVGDLANAQPSEVARLLGTTEVRAMSFIDAARNM